MVKRAENVLLTRFSALGDVAMTIPVVYDACNACPDVNFIFLTGKHQARLFVNKPANLTVEGLDTGLLKGFRSLTKLASRLKREYYPDMCLDLHDVLRTKVIRTLLRLKGVRTYHISKGRAAKRALTRPNNKLLVQLKPTPERYREVFAAAGIPAEGAFSSVFGDGKGPVADFAAVTPPKQPGSRWLAIAPFAKHDGKIYPPELMKQVVDHFAVRPEYRIFIFGFGNDECDRIDAMAQGRDNVVNMARAAIGINAEMSLLSHCDVMLSMDSANMHLASLVGLPAVTVWGATHPFAGFLGINQKADDICQLDLTCRPCSVYGNRPCRRGDYHCLYGIPPALVCDKLSRYMR